MQINVNVDDREVKGLFNNLQKKMGDLTSVMQDIGEIVRRSIIKNFDAGGRPKPWAKSKRAGSSGGTTLTDTARLKKSFTVNAKKNRVAVGTNVKYAAIHQFGGIIRAKNKPYLKFNIGGRWAQKKEVTISARPFMLVQGEDWKNIKARIIEEFK